jgi:hypothetical protein
MKVPEKYSKAWIEYAYNISQKTRQQWFAIPVFKAKLEPTGYNENCKLLSQEQIRIIKEHFGPFVRNVE